MIVHQAILPIHSRTSLRVTILAFCVTVNCGGSKKASPLADGSPSGGTSVSTGSGGTSSDSSPCSGPVGRCEPLPLTTSTINLASGSAPIAAIETSGCAVSWSVHLWSDSFPNVASTACVAGATSDGSSNCVRYPCSPADGGISCAEALVQIYTTHCSVTVIATTGETQTFDITLSPGTYRIFCRTSDGTCVENSPQIVTPPQVTLAFSLLDSGADLPSQ
jgi:hypothetical protein